ncbi:response regulator [Winogradskyella pulchriflava]|uniref:Response regulator n=1 Tax=Winogradskyella pulchriflava TaxID=1110688 RepID=A0ABV6QB83_9FLAO
MIKIAILDDHIMILEGLESLLKGQPDIIITKTFSSSTALMDYLKKETPDVLLLDINLPDANGIDICKTINKKYPDISVIGLSNYSDTSFVKNMMRNGAKGYLLKNTTKEELIKAIINVYNGERYIPETLKTQLLNENFGATSSSFIPKLTRREKEVLIAITNQKTTKEIAEKLFITPKAVEAHRSNLFQKLDVKNVAGLVKVAIEKGLLK